MRKQKGSIETKKNFLTRAPLHIATKKGLKATVQLLLDQGANIAFID